MSKTNYCSSSSQKFSSEKTSSQKKYFSENFLRFYQNYTVCTNVLDTSLELSNKLALDVLNFKMQRISNMIYN